MFDIKVGAVSPEFRIHENWTFFDITDGGAVLIVLFRSPDANEIAQFQSGKPFEIRFTELNDVIMVTTKIGNLDWVDAPYNANLSPNLNKFELPNEGQGLGLTVIFADSDTGEVKNIRLLGLSTNFTRKLFGCVMENKTKPFSQANYYAKVDALMKKYTTRDIVKLSRDYFKI